jgi:hypothetical protein
LHCRLVWPLGLALPSGVTPGSVLQVGVVPVACGGTNLYEQWQPGRTLYDNMIERTEGAMRALGHRGRLAGMIWVQVCAPPPPPPPPRLEI